MYSMYLSELQILGVIFTAFNLCVFMYYFIIVPLDYPLYITNQLYLYFVFKLTVSFNIGIQNLLFIFYFLRFRVIEFNLCVYGIVFVCLSYISWLICATIFTDPTHLTTFGLYITCDMAYWVVIYLLDRHTKTLDNRNYIFIWAASFFVIMFCVLNLAGNDTAFIYEHMAMITYNASILYFYVYHDLNPFALITLEKYADYV